MIQRTINERYLVIDHLGSGNQGEVLLALDQKLDRKVALKLLKPAGGFDRTAQQSLRREAMVMARFNHPNVVGLHDYELTSDNNWPFLVMEFLRGETLEQSDLPLTDDELGTMVTQVGGALQNAHSIGLVHRDLKPANVMLVDRAGPSARFVVLDLGIAKLSECARRGFETFGSMTFSGAGTPCYMSPEQAESRAVDHRADIYAMGIMIYEFMAGHTPFVAESGSLRSLLNAVAIKRPPDLIDVAVRDCSVGLNDLVMQCLEKDPEKRPESMQELSARFHANFKPQRGQAASEKNRVSVEEQPLSVSPCGTLSLQPAESCQDQDEREFIAARRSSSVTDRRFSNVESTDGTPGANGSDIRPPRIWKSFKVPALAIAVTVILAFAINLSFWAYKFKRGSVESSKHIAVENFFEKSVMRVGNDRTLDSESSARGSEFVYNFKNPQMDDGWEP